MNLFMSSPIAESFRDLNFHDYTLIDVRILPSQFPRQGMKSVVQIQLRQNSESKPTVIQFSGCANLRVAMDFDVLAGNLDPNTSDVDAHTDPRLIQELMESQEADWNVGYGSRANSPLKGKLAALDEFVFFRVQFFGGAIDVIARDFRVETA